jgi:hypothetical protein
MIKLKYVGTGQYIMMIPMRDITDYDIVNICERDGIEEGTLIQQLIDSKLYISADEYSCQHCDKVFKSWTALNKHEMKHAAPITTYTEARKDSEDG